MENSLVVLHLDNSCMLFNFWYQSYCYKRTCQLKSWRFVENMTHWYTSIIVLNPYLICIHVLGTDHLTWRGGYGFLFRSEICFRTTQELEYLILLSLNARNFFPQFNIRLYNKNSESDFFSSTKIRIFFSATLGIRIFF
jgi:hypothetical protein